MVVEERLVDVPRFADCRGELFVLEQGKTVPFAIKRAFIIRRVPEWAARGQHAHKRCRQILVAVTGSLTIHTQADDWDSDFRLDNPGQALYVPTGVYVEMREWTPDAVLLVLASERYNPDDYVVRE